MKKIILLFLLMSMVMSYTLTSAEILYFSDPGLPLDNSFIELDYYESPPPSDPFSAEYPELLNIKIESSEYTHVDAPEGIIGIDVPEAIAETQSSVDLMIPDGNGAYFMVSPGKLQFSEENLYAFKIETIGLEKGDASVARTTEIGGTWSVYSYISDNEANFNDKSYTYVGGESFRFALTASNALRESLNDPSNRFVIAGAEIDGSSIGIGETVEIEAILDSGYTTPIKLIVTKVDQIR